MASIHVVFDSNDRITMSPERDGQYGIKSARLAIAEDLEDVDIYNIARKLAELLLEQLPK